MNAYAAHALGDPTVTLEEVTPQVFPSGPLFPTEVHPHTTNFYTFGFVLSFFSPFMSITLFLLVLQGLGQYVKYILFFR